MTRDEILALREYRTDSVDVAGWGKVMLREMSGRDRFTLSDAARDNAADFMAEVLVRSVCDEAGARLFKDDDAAALAAKPLRVIETLFERAMVLNGMDKTSREADSKN
jgi:hypothetical protein